MAKGKRITPYRQKARGGGKEVKNHCEIKLAAIDSANARAKLEVMTVEEMTRVQQVAAQNALNLFNKLLEELMKRVPDMNDEVLSNSLLSVWEKVGGGKK